jgi:hypothetical protein
VFAQPATDWFPDPVAVQDCGQLAIFIGLERGIEWILKELDKLEKQQSGHSNMKKSRKPGFLILHKLVTIQLRSKA